MARRRYKRAAKKQHGWDLMLAVNDIVLGDSTPGNNPYLIARAIQSYSGGASNLVGEPDPFYCQRIILEVFPYVFRQDPSGVPTRLWQYMLLTAELNQLLTWAEFGATSLALASFWNNDSEVFDIAQRVLTQGVMPVYDEGAIAQDGYAGPLFTGATGTAEAYAFSQGSGPERLSIDIDPKFSLSGDDVALVFLAGPTATADWEDGDQFTTEMFCKSLWTRRQT